MSNFVHFAMLPKINNHKEVLKTGTYSLSEVSVGHN